MRKLSAVAQGMNNVGIGWRITERQYLLVETTDGTVVYLFVQSQRKHSIFCSTCPSYCICLLWYLQSRITVKCPFVCFFQGQVGAQQPLYHFPCYWACVSCFLSSHNCSCRNSHKRRLNQNRHLFSVRKDCEQSFSCPQTESQAARKECAGSRWRGGFHK